MTYVDELLETLEMVTSDRNQRIVEVQDRLAYSDSALKRIEIAARRADETRMEGLRETDIILRDLIEEIRHALRQYDNI